MDFNIDKIDFDNIVSEDGIKESDSLLTGILKDRNLWAPKSFENSEEMEGVKIGNISGNNEIANCKRVWAALLNVAGSLGLQNHHLLGIMANIMAESRFNPATYNPNDAGSESSGLCQWHLSRINNFVSMFGKKPHEASINDQIKFFAYECQTSEKRAIDILKTTKNSSDAAYSWATNFERCAIKYRDERRKNVDKVLSMLKA